VTGEHAFSRIALREKPVTGEHASSRIALREEPVTGEHASSRIAGCWRRVDKPTKKNDLSRNPKK
jgi:hypothetical protein